MNFENRISSTDYFVDQRQTEMVSTSCATIDPLDLLIDHEENLEESYLLASELIPTSKDML